MEKSESTPKRNVALRLMNYSRYIIWIAVICTTIGSAVLLLIGTFEMISAIWHALTHLPAHESGALKLAMIESVDTFLVATVLILIALGLYQLFVNREIELPPWLDTHSVEELERRLAGMVIIVAAVMFLIQAVQWKGDINILWFGLAIGSVILAISAFLHQESKREHEND